MKAANKGASAESLEERASTKGNPGRQSTHRTQCRVPQAADRSCREEPEGACTLTPDALRAAGLKKEASAGVDGVGLDERLLDLHSRLHRGGGRRRWVPGHAALEDKIVQKAVVDVILTPIHEVDFLGYGFRPRGALDALASSGARSTG